MEVTLRKAMEEWIFPDPRKVPSNPLSKHYLHGLTSTCVAALRLEHAARSVQANCYNCLLIVFENAEAPRQRRSL